MFRMRSMRLGRMAGLLLACVSLLAAAGCTAPRGIVDVDTAVQESRGYLRQQLLSSDNPVIRAQAIEGMQTAPWPEATRYIEHALGDPHRGVRFAAAMALGKLRDPASAGLLQGATNDENLAVRAAAIYALYRLDQKVTITELAKLLLYANDEEVRRNVALIFGELNDPTAMPVLKKALHDTDVAVRWHVHEAMARAGDREAIERLTLFAHSGYGDERLIGILALGRVRDRQAAATLRDMLHRNQALEVKLAAARALGMIGLPSGQEIAEKALTFVPDRPNPRELLSEAPEIRQVRVRSMAALALAEVAGPEVIHSLLERMRRDDPRVAVAAAAAVLRIADRLRPTAPPMVAAGARM